MSSSRGSRGGVCGGSSLARVGGVAVELDCRISLAKGLQSSAQSNGAVVESNLNSTASLDHGYHGERAALALLQQTSNMHSAPSKLIHNARTLMQWRNMASLGLLRACLIVRKDNSGTMVMCPSGDFMKSNSNQANALCKEMITIPTCR